MSTSRSLRTRPSKQIEEQPSPSKEMEEPRSTRNKTRSQSTEQPTPSEEPRSTRSKRRVQPEKNVEESTPTRRSKRTKSVDGSAASPIQIKEESEPVDQKVPASSSSEAHSAEKAKDPSVKPPSAKKAKKAAVAEDPEDIPPRFVGEPIPAAEARQRWPKRYEPETKNGANQLIPARAHYKQAEVDGVVLSLFDDVFVKGEDDKPDYIGKIMEFFDGVDREPYFASRWFYRAQDTVIKDHAKLIDEKRVFYSDVMDDNPLDCIVSKIKIAKYSPNMSLAKKKMTNCDFYCDMTYSPTFSTIDNLPADFPGDTQESSSTVSKDESCVDVSKKTNVVSKASSSAPQKSKSSEMALLDLYSGCGAMSTGLCLGAAIAGVKLVTRWAVDMNQPACESLKINHPETKVRNEKADDFLLLLREWKKLCKDFSLLGTEPSLVQGSTPALKEEENEDDSELSPGEFEVDHFVDICFGDPNEKNKPGMHLKVRWKGYGQDEDTWEPLEELSNCQEKIREFVTNGYNMKILPLPGDVAVVCGGPPCQGVSGFNRFRNSDAPLEDPKNHQLVVFMDIVNYLKPKYVLMENVVDILKFAGGYLGRYALSRLVSMNYQSRLGIMAAGRYGLPQYRMRAFLWGAFHTEKLPQYPLPTHDVVVRGGPPCEFELNVVAYEENQPCTLEKALCLKDAISDLPPVTNYEDRDEMPYGKDAKTEFQKHIRLMKHELVGFQSTEASTPKKPVLYDHRPLQLNEDDYQRVCHIPKKKGANFRDLPGVLVGKNNVVEWDENVQRVLLPSGKPLVPDYAMTFVKGKSKKPFARLWWDETVPTVVTRAEPHNQRILHPEQDRVLSVRENARLQGFPDYYKLSGAIKDRYTQVGNAVAVPVARALGYSLGLACQGTLGDGPLLTLPPKFPFGLECVPIETVDDQDSNS